MIKIGAGIIAALAVALAFQTWRLNAVRDDLTAVQLKFGTCKADYSKILEDVRDDAVIDNTPLDELLDPEWLLESD